MTESATIDFAPGTTVGSRYRIEGPLGRGGMGAVYAARHTGTGRGVAVKFLLANEPDLRRRMQREAHSLGAVAHPNVVSVLDVGEHEGTVYLVMERLAGKNLRDFVDGRILPPAEAIALVMPALQGVEAAHRAGILHRDLKPDNLFVVLDEDSSHFDTKVLDFGIARPLGRAGAIEITRSGAVVGTPKYMAPEQIRGSREMGPEVDVFALGLILYELTIGRSPYDATSYESLIIEIATQIPVSPKIFAPDMPDAFAAVLLQALEKRPEDRFHSIVEFARALEPFAPDVRFVPPRKMHAASLLDSEDALVPAFETTPSPAAAWFETPEPTPDRPSAEPTRRRGLSRAPEEAADDAALARTDRSDRPGPLDLEASFTIPKSRARRTAVIVVLGIVAVLGFGTFALRSASHSDSAAATTETATPSAASEGVPASPTEPAARSAPSAPSAPSSASAVPLPAQAAPTAIDATRPEDASHRARTRAGVAESSPTTTVSNPPTPPPTEMTQEAHGRAGTIRSDDF